MEKKLTLIYTAHIKYKINLKWVIGLNAKHKAIKLSLENIG